METKLPGGHVDEVRVDGLLARVWLGVGDQALTAVITVDALRALRLRRGEDAIAIVMSTEVLIRGTLWHLETRDIRHVYIRPRTPHLNGKVERSHRVDDQEFYQLLDEGGITDDIHLWNEKLREWEDYYNYHRPHGGLDGQTPYERLMAKTRAGVLPGS